MRILNFIEDNNGKINANSLESIKASQEICSNQDGEIFCISFNPDVANSLKKYNVNEIILIENDNLNDYSPLFYTAALEQIINDLNPDLILFGHTYQTRDWVPRLSARLDIPFISDCTNMKFDGNIKFVRQLYQGKVSADYSIDSFPIIASFQSGSYRTDQIEQGSSESASKSVSLDNVKAIIKPGEKFEESESKVDLSQAEIIVSIGRGIGKEENLSMIKELAEKLDGNVASSRPIVDSGWLEPFHQIGSSGQTVAPKLYLALGMSGAIQHIVGMKGSQNIVVINKDPNAPFFELADYAVVGDILEIIPKLIENLD